MSEIVLGFVVEQALSKVLASITEEIKLASGLHGELNRLRDSLGMVRDLLQDADEQQMVQISVRRWLKKLKLWAFDAEDLLDELAYEVTKRKVETEIHEEEKGRNLSKFLRGANFFQKTAFRIKMAHKVKRVGESLDEIKKEAAGFGLRLISTDIRPSYISSDHATDSIIDHPVVARKSEVSSIVNLLAGCCNQRDLTVVVIVGMGGIGKTTVAKLVYQEAAAKRLFDLKMWVCVSADFDEKKILEEMLQTLNKNAGGITNKDATLRHLAQELDGKSFLLVLDNVWNQDSERWDRLKSRLSSITKSNGNAVVATTRSHRVATLMETSPQCTHKLNLLSNDECWSIIRERVLGDSKVSISSELEVIGKEIASKCRGLPLAARVIGGTLHRNTMVEEWSAIKNSNLLNVSASEVSVNSILRLSFDRLPFHLKPCFAYCSIFPKSAFLWKMELIGQWSGHGLLDSSMKDAGQKYFNELLRSSFFLDAKYDQYGNLKGARMHDLVHELALSISMSDTWNLKSCSTGSDASHIQHLNIIPCGGAAGTIPVFLRDQTKALRTLFAASDDVFYDSCKFKRLRILRLRGRNVEVLPASIGKLKHLRFLDVSYSEITALPETITELYNLQVLWMFDCKLLESLPKRLKKLVSLKRIIFSYEKQMPSEVGCMTNLHRLSFFVVGPDRGGSIQELESLNELTFELTITNLELVRDEEEAKKANLRSKRKLDKLELVWSGGRDYSLENSFAFLGNLTFDEALASIEDDNASVASEDSVNSDENTMNRLSTSQDPEGPFGSNPNDEEVLPPIEDDNASVAREDSVNLDENTMNRLSTSQDSEGPLGSFLNDEEVLKGLEPSENLKGLVIKNYLGEKFPLWLLTVKVTRFDGSCCTLNKLTWLRLEGCERCEDIPRAGHLPLLKRLEIVGLNNVRYIGDEFYGGHEATTSDGQQLFPALEILVIESMKNLVEWKEPITFNAFPCLKKLLISNCPMLRRIPVRHLSALVEFTMEFCDDFGEPLFDETRPLASLCRLQIKNCANIVSLPSLEHLGSLQELKIICCSKLVSLPRGLKSCLSLSTLFIWSCHQLASVPEELRELRSLTSLTIAHCPNVSNFTGDILECLTQLKGLGLNSHYEGFNSIQHVRSLQTLVIAGRNDFKFLPDQLQSLTAIKKLQIHAFDGLEALPEWLGKLSALQCLTIASCANLKYLPSAEALRGLSQLKELKIYFCPLLTQSCARDIGTEWLKICHIPKVSMDEDIPKGFTRHW